MYSIITAFVPQNADEWRSCVGTRNKILRKSKKKKNNSLNACCKYIFSRAKEDELDFDEYEEFLLYTRDIILKPRIKREEEGLNESD